MPGPLTRSAMTTDAAVIDRRAYARPGVALVIAVVGFLLTAAIVTMYPGLRLTWLAPGWVLAIVDLVVISLPMVVAIWIAVQVASKGFLAAVGLRQWRASDLIIGLGIAVVARALVEIVSPTAGGATLGNVNVAGVAIGLAVAVLISPLIEELFFRGLVQRALGDIFITRDVVAGVIVVAVSTFGFVALHLIPAVASGSAIPIGTLVGTAAIGIGCGTLVFITGRLGGALVAHLVFNAIGVALLIF
ncbi:CPBP family glutamic-type intramembrane protease (plasmid) [Coraliomargarita sp. W4R53]